MRKIIGIFFGVVTIVFVYLLNKPMGSLPALGKLLDPMNGCWANAEPVNRDFSYEYKFPTLEKDATVWIDDRLVPHIHASTDHDLYFLQGYIHATFRLWQMDMQSRAAAGRVSEVVGEGENKKVLNFDRKQRRKGMVFAAENSVKSMESDPRTKIMVDAYVEGINTFIKSLKFKEYPLEYKLMGFEPEKWTTLKVSLLLKYMADDLTGYTEDIPLTYLRDVLSPDMFNLLYPANIFGSSPVIPVGTKFDTPTLKKLYPPDNAFPKFDKNGSVQKTAYDFNTKEFESYKDQADGIGSNNWAVGGSRTKSGASILCNDPHLMLNLPSLWFEIQLQTPNMNVYGVSLPGAPGVVIGFNDSLAWGFTNNYRDVKDFFAIKTVETDKNKYWFEGKQLNFTKRIETIAIKGGGEFTDTVNYTIHGPVMYDEHFTEPNGYKQPLAMCWTAHRATNELKAVYLLNSASNYNQFTEAIFNYQCPAQNMAFADRNGNVALWGQGQFINKWKDQGKYIMNGTDSSTLWKELIPMDENPHVFNPERGFVSSANQCVTDSTFPYWYNGYFVEFRAWRINQMLSKIEKATVEDMFAMQNDVYSWLAANTLPIMLKNFNMQLKPEDNKYFDELKKWDYTLTTSSTAATVYQIWWFNFYNDIWEKILSGYIKSIPDKLLPAPERTMQLFASDTFLKIEEKQTLLNKSFNQALDSIHILEKTIGTEWYKVKNTSVKHLAKLSPFSFEKLKMGGWSNTINAVRGDHGPSWRMVVEMGKEINAFGVYPGGQSGNPGSKYYSDFLQQWVDGKYNKLLFLPNSEKQTNSELKYILTVHP